MKAKKYLNINTLKKDTQKPIKPKSRQNNNKTKNFSQIISLNKVIYQKNK